MQSSLYALAAALGDTLTADAGTIVVAAFATLTASTLSYALGRRRAAELGPAGRRPISRTVRRRMRAEIVRSSGPGALPAAAPSVRPSAPVTAPVAAPPRMATPITDPAPVSTPAAEPPPSATAGGLDAGGGGEADDGQATSFSAYELRLREREFLAHLAARTGRDLSAWMHRITEQRRLGAGRNALIDWLMREGFEFCWASWLERIHVNDGRPLYDHEDGPAEPRRGFTFLSDQQAFRLFSGFLRDIAAGRHALCESDDPDAPRAIRDLLDDRERSVDWMTQDELHGLYLAWCRFAGYVPVERVALMAQAGETQGATKKRFFKTAGQMARLVARHAGQSLPDRPTVVRVWSWQEMLARARSRDDTARRVTTWADDAWTGADGRKAKPRKRQLKPHDSGSRVAA